MSTILLTFPGFLNKSVAQEIKALELAKARIKYYTGHFNEAIAIINKFLKTSELSKSEKVETYEVLALAYLANGNHIESKFAVKKIIEEDKNYKPVTNLLRTTDYIKLVEEVRKEAKLDSQWDWGEAEPDRGPKREVPNLGSRKKWPWIAIGAGVAGGVAAFLTLRTGESGSNGFPAPPSRPGGN